MSFVICNQPGTGNVYDGLTIMSYFGVVLGVIYLEAVTYLSEFYVFKYSIGCAYCGISIRSEGCVVDYDTLTYGYFIEVFE